jgi:glycosyltransferase involved in cell wall biosynthesis
MRSDRIALVPLFFRPAGGSARDSFAAMNSAAPLLLTVGGIAHTKGQLDVVAALPALCAEFPGLSYHMVGEVRDASYLRALQRLARRLGVADRIVVSSNIDADALAALRMRADLYVQPSHEEGFCLAYAEAAACIARLVGTETGAIAEMSRDDPGATVVPVRDPKALALAIGAQLRKLLPEDVLASRRRRLEERFAFDAYIAAHEALYRAAPRCVE